MIPLGKADIRKILTILAVFLGCGLLVGWAQSWEQIRQVSAGVNSVQAGFVQRKHLKILSRPMVSEGRFYFRSPDALRWEYLSPVRSVLLLHKGDVKRYIQQNNRLVEENQSHVQVMKFILPEIAAWNRGNFDSSPTFSAALKPGRKTRIILTPKDKGMRTMIQAIEITLSEKPGEIETVRIIESDEAYTVIEFKNVRTNQRLDDNLFRAG
jgi:outer membrane lipoprotein carrier protein